MAKDYITANAMDKKDKHMMIIIDDEQAEVVRNIFNRYWGYSIGSIIKRLEMNDIK